MAMRPGRRRIGDDERITDTVHAQSGAVHAQAGTVRGPASGEEVPFVTAVGSDACLVLPVLAEGMERADRGTPRHGPEEPRQGTQARARKSRASPVTPCAEVPVERHRSRILRSEFNIHVEDRETIPENLKAITQMAASVTQHQQAMARC
jgi:hypothetical protein